MDIKPLYDKLVVEKVDVTQEKVGNLYTPTTASVLYTKGTVRAVGDGRWEFGKLVPLITQVDDVVVFPTHLSIELKHEGKTYLLVSERDIYAKFN